MCNNISWSTLYRHRRAAAARFGSIFALPIAKRASDIVVSHVRDGQSMLEVGAGDRRMKDKFARTRRAIDYRSLDIDTAQTHDYRRWEEVDRSFDTIAALEVIEHLSLAEIGPWLEQLRSRLKPGGTLVLSTPNTFYPPAFLRDATHQTPLCYDELAGLLTAAGFEVTHIWRIYHDPLARVFLRRYLFGWLFRLIGIDFARQIVVVAVNPGDGAKG